MTEGALPDRPRVLVVDEELPWPANSGKRLRTLNLLSALAADFALDLLVHANGATTEARAEIARRGIAVHVASSQIPDRDGPGLPLRMLASVARGLPYSVYSHQQRGYARELAALLQRNAYDLLHCEWTPYAPYASDVQIPVCIAAHNVEWEIWSRMAATERRPLHRALFRLQTNLMQRFEREVFAHTRFATAVSDLDAASLRAMGCRQVSVVPNGVDAEAFQPPALDTPEPRSLAFSGSMDWRANQDAIRWFIDEIHPRLISHGDYRLSVVGRSPPEWMRDSSLMPPQIVVTGSVDRVQPYLSAAEVCIVPLRVGGGSRLKILEALAMARPVVSTTVGAEGLAVQDDTHLLLADSADRFAAAVRRLWADGALRRRLGQAGRVLIESQYRWEQIAPLQAAVWRDAIAAARTRRDHGPVSALAGA